MNPFPSVGIAILNWNGRHFLQTLLPLLQQLNYPHYTVYVIDNHSTDDSVLFLKNNFPAVKIIVLDDNYGFAKGYNLGLAAIEEDYYLMLNSDVEVGKDLLQPMVAMMESDPKIAICQPKVLALRNKEYFEHAGAAGGMIDILGYPFCRGRIFDTVEKDDGQYNNAQQVFWATGTCCLIRKEAYRQIQGMYNYYFMHMEEIDMCWRLNSAGYKIMYCPQSIVYHLGGGSLPYQSAAKTYYNFRNNIIMCYRNSPWYVNCWLLPLRFLMDVAAALQFAASGNSANTKVIGRAYVHFFKWLLSKEKETATIKKSLSSLAGVLHKSIVWQYYVRKKKRYTDIVK
ncbi:glycosyltransferase family 2 protein [Ilyomonas limi]|uniref:Glycosyltransferase family 2 protein n=1 Tax=Ilyomonas limi TaxID=2575867 RepID=A0A4U3KSN3_9BACT|nr:glycosyltransferase family 2 protein [Ilyomonas limi]TKK65330.1 glycosyltransferase family 2 protein [Ilyomonas limi]